MAVRGDSEALERALAEVMEHLASHLEPLAREYVAALESAALLRAEAQAEPFSTLKSGRTLIHPGFEAADRDARRAIQLAKALELNKPRPAREADVFAGLDAAERPVSLADRRNRRGGAKRA
jgi:hypothetical protein